MSLRVVLTSNKMVIVVFVAFASESKLVVGFLFFSVEQKLQSGGSNWSEFVSITITFCLTRKDTILLLH